jgi:hypothetical protein
MADVAGLGLWSGRLMQTLLVPCEWRDLPNGDIEVRMRGKTRTIHRSQDTNGFVFEHDEIIDLHCDGILQGFRLDGKGNLVWFQVGPLEFRVEDWEPMRDRYWAVIA